MNTHTVSQHSHPKSRLRGQQEGSAMTIVLLGVSVLSLIIASVLFSVTTSYRTTTHAANWQESLLTAETGADFAMATLRKTITDPVNAWSAWQTVDAAGQPLPNDGRRYVLPSLNATSGAGGSAAIVHVDAPPSLRTASGQQWYRIRSTGSAPLTSTSSVGSDKRDGLLRKLSFRTDRKTGAPVSVPHASRMVEIVARPSSFENAVVAEGRIAMNNWQIVVDSYDSRDSSKSTNGVYDEAKRQQNGDVATNGQIVDAGGAHVYGDVLTNAGTVTGAANVTGEQRTDFYQELLPVQKPTWSPTSSNPAFVDNTATLSGGTKTNPTRYKLSWITLTGGKNLTIAPSAPGVDSYIEIWVVGDLTTSGNGGIILKPNANVKIYVEGNVSVTGNGIINEAQRPANLQLLGVAPTDGAARSFTLSGNGSFTGAVYAPNHAVVLSGGGSNGNYFGAIAAKTVSMTGNTAVHYDEALALGDVITDFKVAGWFEDNR